MKLYYAISLVVVAAQVSDALNISFQGGLNGYYTCAKYTFAADGSSDGHDAECAVFSAPLCYPGICEVPDCVNPTVDIFVKRIPAVSDPETARNVWLVQGGPVEFCMDDLHSRLNGAVNVYTIDHRGTGPSTLLDCVVAQVGVNEEIDPLKVPACAQAVQRKYESLLSFSITSAAMDVATFISDYTNGTNTIVYSGSYGTALVERLMHLNCSEVTGYVLDGIATTSGAP
ncbi:unnamed protein product [Peronospora belbahrii]|uniref:AB hydrolase-1 domain-containing protein n=1 Tax=Peronospora belbahrii TaxID=622444 RepID=A0ABN8D481_9STRA|nr:unnamed protein product [Peronospora belbahrii]